MSKTAYATMQSREIGHLRLHHRQEMFSHTSRQQALLEIKMILASGIIMTGAILMVSMLT